MVVSGQPPAYGAVLGFAGTSEHSRFDFLVPLSPTYMLLTANYARTPRIGFPPRERTMRTPSGDSRF